MGFAWLFLLLIGIELWSLIKIGTALGAFNTIILFIAAGIFGMAILRREGFKTLMRFQQRLNSGESPAVEVMNGMLLALAGVLLMLPGFISDVLALLLLIPPLRRLLVAQWLKRSLLQQARYTATAERSGKTTNVIEGEFRREE